MYGKAKDLEIYEAIEEEDVNLEEKIEEILGLYPEHYVLDVKYSIFRTTDGSNRACALLVLKREAAHAE